MNHSEDQSGMPLFVWARVLIITIVVLVTLYLLLTLRDKIIGIPEVVMHPLEEYQNCRDNKIDFYFLGSSLTNNALNFKHSLDSTLSGRKEKLNYKTVVCSSSSLQDFVKKIREIRELRPRYLFIESNIACVDMHSAVFWKMADNYTGFRDRLARIPDYLIRMGSDAFKIIPNSIPNSFSEQNNVKFDFDKLNPNYDYNLGKRFRVRNINEFPLWTRFYKDAEKLGVRIYLLELPRSYEADQNLPEKFKNRYNALIKQYDDEYKIKYISFPYKLDRNRYYLDRAHFNKSGSYFYCQWLINELRTRELLKCN